MTTADKARAVLEANKGQTWADIMAEHHRQVDAYESEVPASSRAAKEKIEWTI